MEYIKIRKIKDRELKTKEKEERILAKKRGFKIKNKSSC